MTSHRRGAQYWVEQLSQVQLPVLSGVMRELNAVTRSDDSSVSNLAEIILKDASLTAKVLRVANSVYHNPQADKGITTISRAIVQIGFSGIKAICLSVMLVDTLLKKQSKQRMLEWMARGFHMAVQAENLMRKATGNDCEDVFVTSLLMHVGEMAFWSMTGEKAEQLDQSLESGCRRDEGLEREMLGTTMREISLGLADQWQLGDDLVEALNPPSRPSKATEAVLLAERISEAAEAGWDSPEFNKVLAEASFFTGLNVNDARQLLLDSADKAASVAVTYGANKICHFIPSSSNNGAAQEAPTMKADPRLQLDILREIGSMVQQKIDVNTLFQMVVEGLHRGVGLERVCLCLVNPKNKQNMMAKYVLGSDTKRWREEINYSVRTEHDNLLAYCLHSRQVLWQRRNAKSSLSHLVDLELKRTIDVSNCMMVAVQAGSRQIGLLIADRGFRGPDITEEQYESFCHFAQQTNMSLSMLAAR